MRLRQRGLTRLLDEKPELDKRGRPLRNKMLRLYYHDGIDRYTIAADSDVVHSLTRRGAMMYLKDGVRKGHRLPDGTTEKQARAVFALLR